MKKQQYIPLLLITLIAIFSLVSCIIPSPKIAFPSPADKTVIFSENVTLFWDHFNYFESFDIWFGDSIENLEKIDNIMVNHYSLNGLEWGKEYYWKVVGFKTEKNSLESPVWSFTVGKVC